MAADTDSDPGSDPDRGCRKCGHDEVAVGEIAVSNRGFEAMADIDARNFQVIYCTNCGYTEHYNANADEEDLADLFFQELRTRRLRVENSRTAGRLCPLVGDAKHPTFRSVAVGIGQ